MFYCIGELLKFGSITSVEPRITDIRLIRTPRYYGQFALSLRKAHTFSLTSTRLMGTPVNTVNGDSPPPPLNQQILIEIQRR